MNPVGSIDALVVPLNAEELHGASLQEKAFLLIGGHIFNELNMLNKYLSWSINSPEDQGVKPADPNVGQCQALLAAKLTAGKCAEAWHMVEVAYHRARLGQLYGNALSSDSQAALASLKRYFGRSNLIRNLRNNYSFHYSLEEITSCWDELIHDPKGFESLFGDCGANTFHKGSEFAALMALLRSVDSNLEAALAKVLPEIQQVSTWLSHFIDGVIVAILTRHLGGRMQQLPTRRLELSHRFREINIPYFTVVAEESEAPSRQ